MSQIKAEVAAMLAIMRSVVETCKETSAVSPFGSPSSILYLALHDRMGMELNTFQMMMDTLVANGNLKFQNNAYHFVKEL